MFINAHEGLKSVRLYGDPIAHKDGADLMKGQDGTYYFDLNDGTDAVSRMKAKTEAEAIAEFEATYADIMAEAGA